MTDHGGAGMNEFEVAVLLLGVAVAAAVLARWLRLPYPILLVIVGLLLSVQPGVPTFTLTPDIVLLAFLPPLLYAAAFKTPWRAFRGHLRAILMLAIGLVLFTMGVVAVVAHEFAGLAWGPAFVLGAIVSPPDAVAAVAVLSRMQIPKSAATVLEGESLINDAAALVAYRLAVGAAVAGEFVPAHAVTEFLTVGAGGVALGLLGGAAAVRLHGWLDRTGLGDTKVVIAMTLLTPFAVYLPAEHLHVSGVLAAVTCGLWVGHRATAVFAPEILSEGRSVWETVEFMLNALIFVAVGFQLPGVLDSLSGRHGPWELARDAAAVSAAVILSRLAWMYPGAYLPRLFDRHALGETVVMPSWRLVSVVAWTGMRGVVSLAAAIGLPADFPERDRILFLTFWVIFATLVGQGLTLPLVIRWLGVRKVADPDELRKTQYAVPALRR